MVAASLEEDTDPKKFWALDISKECFVGSHLVESFTVAVPILIFLFFSIFVASSTVVVGSKKKLGSKDVLEILSMEIQQRDSLFGIL